MQTFLRVAAKILLIKCIILLWIIHTIAFIWDGAHLCRRWYANVSTGAFRLHSPTRVKAGPILTGGGGSGRVIGSRVTHAGVNDSDMSNNQGNAWSASRSSISQRERISGRSRAGAAAGLLGPAFIIHVDACDGFRSHSCLFKAKWSWILSSLPKK